MKCGEITDSACQADVQPEWRFCPTCGTILGRVTVPGVEDAAWNIGTDGDQTFDAKFQLRAEGYANVRVRCDIDPKDAKVATLPEPDFSIQTAKDVPIRISPNGSAGLGLKITTHDGLRTADTHWTPTPERVHPRRLRFKKRTGAKLVAQPAILFFHPKRTARKLRILNMGDRSTRITILPPDGFQIAQLGHTSDVLHDGGWLDYEITRTGDDPSHEKLKVLDSNGSELELPIVSLPRVGAKVGARFVIGIDFGTSNTSIVVRDTYTDKLEFLPFPDFAKFGKTREEAERFPTVIVMKSPSPADWKYGFEEINYQPGTDRIVYELKNLLRTAKEPFETFGADCKADRILVWYLGKLLDDIIAPFLHNSGAARPKVRFVFSLPVLDRGEQYQMQRRRMEAAIEEAGFSRVGEVSYQFEPVCAALYFLQADLRHEIPLGVSEGDKVLVVDSGGGTTDIAVFTVSLENGQMEMRDVMQIGSHPVGEGEAIQYNQFGGTTLTQLVGFVTDYVSTSKTGGDEVKPVMVRANHEDQKDYNTFDESIAIEGDEFVDLIPREEVESDHPKRWHRRFPRTYRLFEVAKRAMSSHGALLPEAEVFPSDLIHQRIALEAKALSLVIDKEMKKIVKPMLDDILGRVDGGTSGIHKGLLVGGNCIQPTIRERIAATGLSARIVPADYEVQDSAKSVKRTLSDRERMIAVAAGASYDYRPEARTFPYALQLWTGEREDRTKDFELSSNTHGTLAGTEVMSTIPSGESLAVELTGASKDSEGSLARLEIANREQTTAKLLLRVQVQGEELVIATQRNGGASEEALRYEI